ncbi:MAG: SRPBCC domain-containing protein [Pseudolabrys sp.]
MATKTAAKPSLTIKRRFNAPPDTVYAAWTRPEHLARWFGPAGCERIEAEIDPRVGGRYKIGMIMPDDRHDVSGIYREIVPNQKLVFTWAWKSTPERESLVTVTFKEDEGGGTIMTLLHEKFFDEAARDRHNNGWLGTMDKLEKYLAA